ncbi:phage protein Gp37 [Pseudoxanthomonas sp. UTMC 1351]|uniref:phage protein Gp37 n=1 Tax=Pseudoxanthomonas sp. UTMC 1351 TaxID=2695853 RepID=UPI0034CE7792
MSIAQIEQAFIDIAKARFGTHLRTVESLPADWDSETFKRILRLAPGLFVVFGGGAAMDQSTDIRSQWVLLAVTAHASGERARRHGDSREIGAYEIIETAVPLFHDRQVPGVGLIRFEAIENLFTAAIEEQGAAIYGARFSLPMTITAPPPGGTDPLDAFLTFNSTLDAAPADGRPEAEDVVVLPQ